MVRGAGLVVVGLCLVLGRAALAGDVTGMVREGVEASRQGQHREAVERLTEALRQGDLPPSLKAAVLGTRGGTWRRLGELDKAKSDLDQALTLDPQLVVAFFNRGLTHFLLGNFTAAQGDFQQFLQLSPRLPSAYPHLWLFLARERAGVNGLEELKKQAPFLEAMEWPGPLVTLHLGRLTPDEVVRRAGESPESVRKERLCETYFHLGEYHLLRGNLPQAVDFLLQAVATATRQNEWAAAEAELSRLQAKPLSPPVAEAPPSRKATPKTEKAVVPPPSALARSEPAAKAPPPAADKKSPPPAPPSPLLPKATFLEAPEEPVRKESRQRFMLDLGAFADFGDYVALLGQLQNRHIPHYKKRVGQGGEETMQLFVGPLDSREEAAKLSRRLAEELKLPEKPVLPFSGW
ncbi:MAG: SPOR domain-containing protein [Magnetococcales bacterium]|nr:SPOR domain-containing protein [Magnetococcales bacterium]